MTRVVVELNEHDAKFLADAAKKFADAGETFKDNANAKTDHLARIAHWNRIREAALGAQVKK